MIRKRRTVLCREGWYYILVLGVVVGGALMREINLLVVIAGMMFGPLLYNWREVVASIRRLEAERRLPEAICAGDLLVVDVRLHNSSRRYGGWAVVVEDQVRRENSPAQAIVTSVRSFFPACRPARSGHSATMVGSLAVASTDSGR